MSTESHPNEAPSQVPDKPAGSNESQTKKHEFTTGQKIAAGTLGTLVLGIAAYKGLESGAEKGIKDTLGAAAPTTGQVHEAPTPPEYVNGMKVSYKDTPAYREMSSVAAQFDHDRPLARNMLIDPKNQLLTPEEMTLLSEPLPDDLTNATSQQIENIMSYNIFDASDQADKSLGVKFMNITIDPRNPNNAKMVDSITTKGQVAIRNVFKAQSNHPRKQNFTFMNDSVSDGWVIEARDVFHNEEAVSVFEDVRTPDGHEEVVVRDSYDPTNPQVQSELHRLFGDQ